jgi:hypothetical protein
MAVPTALIRAWRRGIHRALTLYSMRHRLIRLSFLALIGIKARCLMSVTIQT